MAGRVAEALGSARSVVEVHARTWFRLIGIFAAALATVVVVGTMYGQAVGQYVVDRMAGRTADSGSLVPLLVVVGTPILVLLLAVGFVWAGAAAYVADGVSSGRRTSKVRAVGASMRRLHVVVGVAVVWCSAVLAAAVAAPLLTVVGVVGLIAAPIARRTRVAGRVPPTRRLVALAVPFGLSAVLAVRWALALPAAWLGGGGVRAALGESWRRVRGASFRVAVVLLSAAIPALGGALLLTLSDTDAAQLGQLAVNVLLGPLPIVAAVVLYRRSAGPADDRGPVDVAPAPGSGHRQAAVAVSVALGLQMLTFVPPTGLVLAGAAPATPAPFDVTVSTHPASPLTANSSVTVVAEAWPDGHPFEDGGPTGQLTLSVGGVVIGSKTLTGYLPHAQLSVAHSFPPGTHDVVAAYEGDANWAPDQTTISVVAGATSTTVLTVDPATGGPVVFGNAVTLSATVSGAGATPAGEVRFEGLPGGTIVAPMQNGTATVVTHDIPPGTHSVAAQYIPAPGGVHLPSSSAATAVTIDPATTTIALSTHPSSPSSAGVNVTATVTVTAQGTPAAAAGTVTIYDAGPATSGGGVPIASDTVIGGVATLDLSLAPGTHNLQAVFDPGTGFGSSHDDRSHVVDRFAAVVTLAAPASSVSGEPVSATVTVAAQAGFVATGSVEFFQSLNGVVGGPFATAPLDAAGSATVAVPPAAVGTYELSASYEGDQNFTAAPSNVVDHEIGLAPVSVTINAPAAPLFGDRIDVVVDVVAAPPGAGSPTGSVQLFDDGIEVDAKSVVLGSSNLSFDPQRAGTRPLTATYSGDAAFATATTTIDLHVAPRPVTMGVFPPAALDVTYGDTVRIDGFVSSDIAAQPTGEVTIVANRVPIGTAPLDAGRFSFSTDEVPAGQNIELGAIYDGDAIFAGNDTLNASQIQRINVAKASADPVLSTTAATPTVGDTINLTVELDDIGAGPTGTVTFATLRGPIGTVAVTNEAARGGVASIDHVLDDTWTTFTATYSGDANFVEEDADLLLVTAAPYQPTVTIEAPGSMEYGQSAVVTVRVPVPAGVPSDGVVELRTGAGSLLAAALPVSQGTAILQICAGDLAVCPSAPRLGIGAHRLIATFSGSSRASADSTGVDLGVVRAGTTLTVDTTNSTPPEGSLYTLTATVVTPNTPATPTGSVRFEVEESSTGDTVDILGVAPLVNGVARLDVTARTNISFPVDRVVAHYTPGTAGFEPSSASTPLTLDRVGVRLTPSVGEAVVYERTRVEVSISNTESGPSGPYLGTVTVRADNGGTCTAVFPPGSRATGCDIVWSTAGPHRVVVSFSGDGSFEPVPDTALDLTVAKRGHPGFSSAPASVFENTTMTITWDLDDRATGTMTIPGEATCTGVPVAVGSCAVPVGRRPDGGTMTVRLQYSGDANWHPHQFDHVVEVKGCYPIRVESMSPAAGTVSIETIPNCSTGAGIGYVAGTEVAVVATAIEPNEFVEWTGANPGTAPATTFVVTDDFRSWTMDAHFRLACHPVTVTATRGEPDADDFPAEGDVELMFATNENNPAPTAGTDPLCVLDDGSLGLEWGSTVRFLATPRFNQWYGEVDLFYGFGGTPPGATVVGEAGEPSSIEFVVAGPTDVTATFGPRCRAFTAAIDPADEAASIEIISDETCASPFGNGFRRHVWAGPVTVAAALDDPELFVDGWTVNGVDAPDLGTGTTVQVPVGDGDTAIVARLARCRNVTLVSDMAYGPAWIGEDGSRHQPEPVGSAQIVTAPNCPDGSGRFVERSLVELDATLDAPGAVVTWSGAVDSVDAAGLRATVIAADDVEVTAAFYLAAVCSRLIIDDPLGLVSVGDTGCGDGYYFDRARAEDALLQDKLADLHEERGDWEPERYDRRVERLERSHRTFIPIRIETGGTPGVFVDVSGRRGGYPECFPTECRGPVTGDLVITAARCQVITPSFSVTVDGDESGIVYPAGSLRGAAYAFATDGSLVTQSVAPWIETRRVSDPIRDENGNILYSACSASPNAHPPDTHLSVRTGAGLPGLTFMGWSGDDLLNIPVRTPTGVEFQTFVIADDTAHDQVVTGEYHAVCRTVSAGEGIRIVGPPPNCPDGTPNRYLLGSVLTVSAKRYLYADNNVGPDEKFTNQFTSGVVPGSTVYFYDDADRWQHTFEGLVHVTGRTHVSAEYVSEEDQLVSAAVSSLKVVAGAVALAGPVLFTTFVCAPCGTALALLATTALVADLAGADGQATAVLDLVNPTSFFQCVGKWGADSPTPSAAVAESDDTSAAESDEARRQLLVREVEETLLAIADLSEDTADLLEDDPDGAVEASLGEGATPEEIAAAKEAHEELLLDAMASMVGVEEGALPELAGVLGEAGFAVGQLDDFTLGDLEELKQDAQFIKKAGSAVKTWVGRGKTAKAFVNGYNTEGLIGLTGRLKGGVRAVKQHKAAIKAKKSPAKVKIAAALEFMAELHEAGYLEEELLDRIGEFKTLDELAGTDTFTDCLDDKWRLAGGV